VPITPTKSWENFFDSIVSQYVLEAFLPPKRRGRVGRRFDRKDFEFFAPSVSELSDLFTEERGQSRLIHHYFDHARFQSAYLLYFYPLHAFKFFSILAPFVKPLIPSQKKLKVLDLGAGPGTASMGMIHSFIHSDQKVPPLELHWIDQNSKIMEHGKLLMERFYAEMPERFEAAPEIHLHRGDAFGKMKTLPQVDWILSGHFLNEESENSDQSLMKLLETTKAKHLLCVEPAVRSQAQGLSHFRNLMMESNSGWHSLSPCLHDKSCPLTTGRDWCHSSQPIEIPGFWFLRFSEWIGSQRAFLKHSHLLLSKDPKGVDAQMRKSMLRVVSDPIEIGKNKWKILLCQPERTQSQVMESARRPRIHRGDLVKSSALRSLQSSRFK
jgi:hypothetical protein